MFVGLKGNLPGHTNALYSATMRLSLSPPQVEADAAPKIIAKLINNLARNFKFRRHLCQVAAGEP